MHPLRGPKGPGIALIGATQGCISIFVPFYGYYMQGCVYLPEIHLAKLGSKQKLHWFKHVMVTQVIMHPPQGPKRRGVAPIGATRGVH